VKKHTAATIFEDDEDMNGNHNIAKRIQAHRCLSLVVILGDFVDAVLIVHVAKDTHTHTHTHKEREQREQRERARASRSPHTEYEYFVNRLELAQRHPEPP